MSAKHYLGIDLGAESGRVMLGTLENGKVTLDEMHRFPNVIITVNGTLRWDVLRLFDEIKKGIAKVTAQGIQPRGLSADTWGVDYCLTGAVEPLLGTPFNYRDSRTDGGFERAFAMMPREEIYRETGIQFMTLNTLYQLHAHNTADPALLKSADKLLCMGDFLNFLFSGHPVMEESLASTTQIYNPKKRAWSKKIISRFKFPKHLFPEVVPSATRIGPVRAQIAQELGLTDCAVVATCSHDTGAAIAAVPATGKNWAYLSSGTWSLMGVELPKPFIKDSALAADFTNEQGLGGTTRFLKNIIGMWLVQECRRKWEKQGHHYDYAMLTHIASEAPAFGSLINPNDARFLKPGGMPGKIQDFARETGQAVPQTHGEIIRCALESLACLYRLTLERMSSVTGKKIKTLQVVGGGIKNELLQQFTADACGVTVAAGPVEATALGNILMQAIALGDISGHEELRAIVADSFPVKYFQPARTGEWAKAVERFRSICG